MKCPHCGHWNKPSFPRCFQCGQALPKTERKAPDWRDQLKAPKQEPQREIYDDASPIMEGDILDTALRQAAPAPKSKEALAFEMNSLRERRARGSAYLEEFRKNAAEQGIAPSGAGVTIKRGGGFFERVPDDPDETLYEPPEIRHMVREGRRQSAQRADRAHDFDEEGFAPMEGMLDGDPDAFAEDVPPAFDDPKPIAPPAPGNRRRRKRRGAIGAVIWSVRLLVLAASAFVIWQGVLLVQGALGPAIVADAMAEITLEEIDMDGLSGRRILISGEEGTQYYISELTKSAVVIGGVAVFEVPDFTFYENVEHLEAAQMDVTLSPTMIKGATEMRLKPIQYTIDIPLSPVRLISPETDYISVATSVYNLRLQVTPGSRVTVNGRDISDSMDSNGQVSDNPPIKAIGENVVTVTVRAPYCRENNLTLIFYREPQEIPLELAADTDISTRNNTFQVNCTTLANARIAVESPYESIDDTALADTGEFKVIAKMVNVGYNTIRIRASYEGKKDSLLEHVVYYLPSLDDYSRKAWKLEAADYKELLGNITQRAKDAQIYKCVGEIVEIIADRPQLAFMELGTSESSRMILLQNESKTTWEVGSRYEVYADVSGLYNKIPRLTGRFTYTID